MTEGVSFCLGEVMVCNSHGLPFSNQNLLPTVHRRNRISRLSNFDVVLVVHGHQCASVLQLNGEFTHVPKNCRCIMAVNMFVVQLSSLNHKPDVEPTCVLHCSVVIRILRLKLEC